MVRLLFTYNNLLFGTLLAWHLRKTELNLVTFFLFVTTNFYLSSFFPSFLHHVPDEWHGKSYLRLQLPVLFDHSICLSRYFRRCLLAYLGIVSYEFFKGVIPSIFIATNSERRKQPFIHRLGVPPWSKYSRDLHSRTPCLSSTYTRS